MQSLKLPSEPVWTRGDAGALEQLFLNLLLNAADALSTGKQAGIDFEQEPGRVRISIWDRGKGIAPEAMEKVFDPFYTTTPEGTGLGLPIARRITQAHGGELEIESTSGEGTTARVSLPRASAVPAERA